MKKGLIMEINERFVTILTPEGEFLRARKLSRDYQIGQEIDFLPVGHVERNKPFSLFNTFKGKAISASVACLLLLVSFIPYYQSNQVYAYMSIDINPSIELGLNKDFQVIELIPYNEDGEKIVSQLKEWNKKDFNEVTEDIINEIKSQGFLKNNHEIVVGTVYKTDKLDIDNQKWIEKWADIKDVIQDENLDLTVVKGTTEEREKAHEKGITVAEYKEELTEVKKKQTKRIKDQKEKPVKEDQPKDEQEQQAVVEPPLEAEKQVEAVAPKSTGPSMTLPKEGKPDPIKENSPKSLQGQDKKDNNLDQPAGNVNEIGPDNAHSSEKVKEPEQTESNADNNEKQNNGIKGNNENNGNNNANSNINDNNSNQGKQKDNAKNP